MAPTWVVPGLLLFEEVVDALLGNQNGNFPYGNFIIS